MISPSLPHNIDQLRPRITVIGVGGAGGNAVNNMIRSNLEGVEFLVCNTDAQSLGQSTAPRKIQLGATITRGLGAGARADVGRAAAEEALDEIMECLDGSNMVFITAGMGGGTGTGAAPVIARAARESGILTVGVVTKPFHFEGSLRMRQADSGIQQLQDYVDTLIIIPNQNLFRIANENTTFADAFNLADQVLHSGVRGVTDLMVMPGLINLDFNDIRSVMSEMGKAMMGTGEAEGGRRAVDAAEAAISNPLLDDVSMKGARGVLINITGGMDMTLFEVDEAANRIRDEVDPEANIIFGSTFDSSMDGRMRVSVVATGIEAETMRKGVPDKLRVVSGSTPPNNGGYNTMPTQPLQQATSQQQTAAGGNSAGFRITNPFANLTAANTTATTAPQPAANGTPALQPAPAATAQLSSAARPLMPAASAAAPFGQNTAQRSAPMPPASTSRAASITAPAAQNTLRVSNTTAAAQSQTTGHTALQMDENYAADDMTSVYQETTAQHMPEAGMLDANDTSPWTGFDGPEMQDAAPSDMAPALAMAPTLAMDPSMRPGQPSNTSRTTPARQDNFLFGQNSEGASDNDTRGGKKRGPSLFERVTGMAGRGKIADAVDAPAALRTQAGNTNIPHPTQQTGTTRSQHIPMNTGGFGQSGNAQPIGPQGQQLGYASGAPAAAMQQQAQAQRQPLQPLPPMQVSNTSQSNMAMQQAPQQASNMVNQQPIKLSQADEDLLEIPAFLRRQAN